MVFIYLNITSTSKLCLFWVNCQCNRDVTVPNLHLLQQCCCMVAVRPGQDPPVMAGTVPPHSPAEDVNKDIDKWEQNLNGKD